MKWFPKGLRRALVCGWLGGFCAGLTFPAASAPVTLYSTQFEAAEGYDTDFTLAGQNGWNVAGAGGNGLLPEDPTYGQSAYIGFDPPTTNGLALWQPVNHNPSNRPIVTVTLDLWVVDSSTNSPNRDEFSWEIYNIQGDRLFALIFDNRDLGIYHQLDNDPFGTSSGHIFTNDVLNDLKLQMNFQANLWNAWIGTRQVISNLPITTTSAALTFGDVDAVWLRGSTNGAGDNYMIFDNLTITADTVPAPVSIVRPPIPFGGGLFLVRVEGEEGAKFAVEASTNLMSWTSLKTNIIFEGHFDYWDTNSVGLPQRFYRARWVP